MTLTIEVGAETDAQARQAAQLEGISVEQYLAELIEDTFAYDAALAELEAGAVARPLAAVLQDIEAARAHEGAAKTTRKGINGAL